MKHSGGAGCGGHKIPGGVSGNYRKNGGCAGGVKLGDNTETFRPDAGCGPQKGVDTED